MIETRTDITSREETRTDITSREETRTEVPSTVMLANTFQPFGLQASREPTIGTFQPFGLQASREPTIGTFQPFGLQASREPTIDTGSEGRKCRRGGGGGEEGREGEQEEEGGKGREGGCSMSTNHRYRLVRPGGGVMGEAMIGGVLAVKVMTSQSLHRFSIICGWRIRWGAKHTCCFQILNPNIPKPKTHLFSNSKP
jgi:hypothetical protein